MREPVSIGLVALGGYGEKYISFLLDKTDPEEYRIVGAVDPLKERCQRLEDITSRGIPIYDTMDEFYARHRADLVTISSPIHFHCPQTCAALDHGSSVLCEKPLGATVQEARGMIEARDRATARDGAPRFVAIGYQWSFSEAVQELKGDILAGRFGRPIRLKTMVLWPRDEKYYHRNGWAGRQKDDRGAWILDSPINNATAHYLHNMLYVLGAQVDRSARLASIVGELYRANAIENYDTGAARILTDDGVELLYIASHPVVRQRGPVFEYEFEEATVFCEEKASGFVARFRNGEGKTYPNPQVIQNKLRDAMSAVRGEKQIVCGPEAAGAQTLCVNGLQDSAPEIIEFPRDLVRVEGEVGVRKTWVDGLFETLVKCYEEWKLPSEAGAPWAAPGREIRLSDYGDFPGGATR